jgi:protein disulfide-isomerase
MNIIQCLSASAAFFGMMVLSVSAGDLWETDFAKAAQSAKASNRYLLLDFTGSDWCGWCMKLDAEVFSKKPFKEYAEANLVCVEVDFPREKKLRKELREQNEKLAKEYGVRGYPTIVLLDPDGKKVGTTGYEEGGPAKYVENLKGIIDPHRKSNGVPAPTALAADKGRSAAGGRLALPSTPIAPVARPAPLARNENREVRTWTSVSGATIQASLVEEVGPLLVLKKEDGSRVKILLQQLGEADRDYVARLKEPAKNP